MICKRLRTFQFCLCPLFHTQGSSVESTSSVYDHPEWVFWPGLPAQVAGSGLSAFHNYGLFEPEWAISIPKRITKFTLQASSQGSPQGENCFRMQKKGGVENCPQVSKCSNDFFTRENPLLHVSEFLAASILLSRTSGLMHSLMGFLCLFSQFYRAKYLSIRHRVLKENWSSQRLRLHMKNLEIKI